MDGPRIGIIGIWLESNKTSPIAKDDDFRSFYLFEGDEILVQARAPHPIIMGEAAGFIKAMDTMGPWQPAPVLLTGCHPWGPVDGALMDSFLHTIRAGLIEAGPLDAI